MRFWNTSAVVPLLVAEAGTGTMSQLLRGDPDVIVPGGVARDQRARGSPAIGVADPRARAGALQTITERITNNGSASDASPSTRARCLAAFAGSAL